MHVLHILIGCNVSLLIGFIAGAFYGKSLAGEVVAEAQKELAAATVEIKKVRGEIWNHLNFNKPGI